MMNRSNLLVSALLIGAITCVMTSCGSSEDSTRPKDQVVRSTPKPRPKKVSKSIDQLMAELSIDSRISLADMEAPRDEAARVAVLRFFDAMVKLDVTTLQSMLSFADQIELTAMIGGGLETYMQDVSLVKLQAGLNPEGRDCVLCIFEIEMEYQVQMWYFEKSGTGYTFSAAETPPNLDKKLSGNWIASYFKLKQKQTEVANQPDEETSYTLAGDTTFTSGSLDTEDGDPPSGPSPGGPRGPSPGGPRGPGGP